MLTNLMDEIASEEVIDLAFAWLCKRREHYSHNQDVWEVRFRWEKIKPILQADLLAGRYRFSPLVRFQRGEERIEVWSALDALVLKAMAIVLGRKLNLSRKCYHLAGHGGAKAAVRDVVEKLTSNQFVMQSDVKSYYASISHDVMENLVASEIDDPSVLELVRQYLHRTVYVDGLYEDVTCGISLGCPLSPIMGALYLKPLDDAMAVSGLVYARFMDDWVILAPTRWKLRHIVRVVNGILEKLKVRQHPDKTFIGRVSRRFDFLGYRITSAGIVGVARRSLDKFIGRINQLYERGASTARIGEYLHRWRIWAFEGVDGLCPRCNSVDLKRPV